MHLNTVWWSCLCLFVVEYKKIASIFLQLCCDWLLKWLTHVCVGRFLIKVHQVVGYLLQWAVLNVWAAAASVLLTRQQAWLHQGHETKGRCTRRILQSIRLLQICIVLCLLLDINLDVHAQNTSYTWFCSVNHKGRIGLTGGFTVISIIFCLYSKSENVPSWN